jgi:hypothetical protein
MLFFNDLPLFFTNGESPCFQYPGPSIRLSDPIGNRRIPRDPIGFHRKLCSGNTNGTLGGRRSRSDPGVGIYRIP